MSDSEKTSFFQFLVTESQKKDQQISHLQKTIDSQGGRLNSMQVTLNNIESLLNEAQAQNSKLNTQLISQGEYLKEMQAGSQANAKALKKALQQADKYKSLYEVLRHEKFVDTSQKFGKSRPEPGRDDNKGNWDVSAQDEPNIAEAPDHKAIQEEETNEIPKEKIKRQRHEVHSII